MTYMLMARVTKYTIIVERVEATMILHLDKL